MIQLNKFTIGDDWVPQKLDVATSAINDCGDCSQSGEVELPEDTRIQQASKHYLK